MIIFLRNNLPKNLFLFDFALNLPGDYYFLFCLFFINSTYGIGIGGTTFCCLKAVSHAGLEKYSQTWIVKEKLLM
jgi:hypothetical protein